MDTISNIKIQSEEHDIVNDSNFASIEEYVLYLMHCADYKKAQFVINKKNVLDIGCNSGYGTYILSKSCNKIVGVDVSKNAIDVAKQKYKKNNLNFQVIDGEKLPFGDNVFDIITSFQVLEHVADYDNYFKEILRVLKPRGVLLLTTPNAEIRVKPGMKPWNRFHVHEFRSDELSDILQKYFSSTSVFGQFATSDVYSIEYKRCTKQKNINNSYIKSNLKNKILYIIHKLNHKIKKYFSLMCKKEKIIHFPEEIKSNFSTNDIFYQKKDLKKSLTLVAVCSEDTLQNEIVNKIFLQPRKTGKI